MVYGIYIVKMTQIHIYARISGISVNYNGA